LRPRGTVTISVGAREVTFLLDISEHREARLPRRALGRGQLIEPFQHPEAILAQAGRRVIVLEKEHFPRFHIGESLLPYNRAIFDELGVLPELERAGLIKKTGAQFHLGNGSKSLFLVFRNGRFTREPEAFQVERATFDDMLLKYAARQGAEVREGWTVSRFNSDASGVTVAFA